MTNLEKRIDALETAIVNEHQSLERTLRTVFIVFISLIILVLGTTSYSWNRINSNFGPKGIKEYGETMVNIVANQPQELTAVYENNKEEWSEAVVDEALAAVPKLETLLKNQINTYVDAKSAEMKLKLFPDMVEFVKSSAPEIKADYATAKKANPELKFEEFLCQLFVDFLDREIKANVVDFDAAEDLAGQIQLELYRLHKAEEPLTRKELAERKVIVNLVIISKMGTEDSPFIQEFHQFLKENIGVTKEQLHEDKVLDDSDVEGVGESTEPLHP